MGKRLAEDKDGLSDSNINRSYGSKYSREDDKSVNTKGCSRLYSLNIKDILSNSYNLKGSTKLQT